MTQGSFVFINYLIATKWWWKCSRKCYTHTAHTQTHTHRNSSSYKRIKLQLKHSLPPGGTHEKFQHINSRSNYLFLLSVCVHVCVCVMATSTCLYLQVQNVTAKNLLSLRWHRWAGVEQVWQALNSTSLKDCRYEYEFFQVCCRPLT